MNATDNQNQKAGLRRLFMVLSPRSLPHANLALKSLFRNSVEPVHLSLITDSKNDQEILADAVMKASECDGGSHKGAVYSASDIDEREQDRFSKFVHLRNFRRGHPCWRKITDPLLLSADSEEMVLLDPDIYFPNRFQFEVTPPGGVLLMWQRPCCLWPPEIVELAMKEGIRLANHVDIGVAHWRGPGDIEWLNWLIGRLGSDKLPRSMHIEAIVWAALAMRIGGGHLDPRHWLCWHSTQYNRVLRIVGSSGNYILSRERLTGVKCFHAGGDAKWWLPEAQKAGILDQGREVTTPGQIKPFVELGAAEYRRMRRTRDWLRRVGYYRLIQSRLN